MTTFEAVMAQYEKNKQTTSGNQNKISQEDRMKKYFTTLLPKGSRGEERRIRILPTKDGSSPFVEVYFHEIQVDGKWVKLYDPKQSGERSPLNEVYEELNMSGHPEDKELAKTYRSRKFYIVKLIDRDNESDGVKFWRFKHNSKGEGVLDKIIPIFRSKGDITDVNEGRDLILTLTLTKSGNNKEYTNISSIIPDDKTPLSTNQNSLKEWTEDTLVWSDVYSKKSVDYLEIVAQGGVPLWDSQNNKWVSNITDETNIVGTQQNVDVNVSSNVSGVNIEPDEDDLPF